MDKAIIIRNLFLLKNKYLKYLSAILLVPIFFYIANVLFFSSFFDYEIKLWSSIGIWFSSCVIVSYIYIYDIFSIFRKDSFIAKSPVSVFKILLSAIFFAIIIGFLELLISYFMISFLSGSSLSFIHFSSIFFSVLPVILLFSAIGMIVNFYDNQNIGLYIVSIVCVSFIQFSQVLVSLKDSSVYFPIYNVIKNIGDYVLIPGSDFKFLPLFTMYSISLIFLVVAFYFCIKKIGRVYDR
ncbi:MAG: hypothetical protein CMG13_06730 [Candidatus Marinimicrobia bacterium]|nr:hypothetical protein [Candidatus Neomarinimicrobiota bacterium]|tara:strand:+ start:549 stop:1265 length:717 start_codon:yes stop_codon:yes gene_type:complete